MSRRILFLVPYPLYESPSQRFRFEQYFDVLEKNGYSYSVQSFLSSRDWRVFFGPGKIVSKVKVFAFGYIKRIFALFKSPAYDFIFIHREVVPLGPPVFEWILAKILRRKIIYDFDDAIWLTDREDESWILRTLKWRTKVRRICEWSYKVSCGNEYLRSYALQFNKNVVYNPTTIDTENLHNPALIKVRPHDNKIRVGWTGSHSTLKYLDGIRDVLKNVLSRNPGVEFVVIADRAPAMPLPSLVFVPWNRETEMEDLLQFDIGVMPLPDDKWAQGKCGFKALQYMALEIPAIASPVGVNSQIIDSDVNGFLCSSPGEWEKALDELIGNAQLRNSMGINGRKKVVQRYSVLSNSATFLGLFE